MNQIQPSSSSALGDWLAQHDAAQAFIALADLVPDAAIFVVDRNQHVIFWSQGAERLLGFSAAEALGEHCLKSHRCAACMQGCGVAAHPSISGKAVELFRADGESLPVRKFAKRFLAPDGTFAGGIEVLVPANAAHTGALPSRVTLDDTTAFHGLLSRASKMRELFEVIRNVAHTDATVLVRGESGAGKELVARALHEESPRATAPFIAMNCASMSPTLLESELFGHEKGSFTGAVRQHEGVFERANGGTLFLDEVAELPIELQAKLLRVLEERTFYRVGGERPIRVDVRVVSATHRSLRDQVQKGTFREDLMFRLRVVPLFLPPLRDRPGDVPLLLETFITRLNERGPRRVDAVHPDAMRALLDHSWPGNVRELKNVVEYAFAVGRSHEMTVQDLPPEFREARLPPGPKPPAAQPDMPTALEEALRASGGRIGDAAERLGMSRATFWRMRKKWGV